MMMAWRATTSRWELHQEHPDGELYYSPESSTRYKLLCSSAATALMPGSHVWTFYNELGYETHTAEVDTMYK